MTTTHKRVNADRSMADNPTPEFIDDLRRRFPTEREVDAMLTRKMRRRSGPPYQRTSMAELEASLHSLLREQLTGDFLVSGLRWFTGGVSKIQVGFTLEWVDGGHPRTERLVVRMDPKEGSNATSRAREFELVKALDGTIPVPKPFWLDADASHFPEPALIYAFANGITKPRTTSTGKISGLGTNFGPEWRAKLAPQFMDAIARIHLFDVTSTSFNSLEVPEVGTTQAARWLLNQARRTWEEDRGEDLPLMEVAANWLERNLPTLDHASIVHGDLRSGNFLFDEDSGQITAWLDWERGHIGDRHRDLAWTTNESFGHYDDKGTYYVCGLVEREEFFARYQEATGLPVDQEKVTFFRVLNAYQIIVSTLASAYRVARLGKSHQDIMLTRVEGLVPSVAAQLRQLLKENL